MRDSIGTATAARKQSIHAYCPTIAIATTDSTTIVVLIVTTGSNYSDSYVAISTATAATTAANLESIRSNRFAVAV